jgi:predicted nucleic acid-binding protein
MVLIWGVQHRASHGQEEMVSRTGRYLRSLRDTSEVLMVPTPVVAEYLQGFDKEQGNVQLATLSRYFYMPAFDVPSAALAAELSRNSEVRTAYAAVGRPSLKIDAQIVATAVIHGAALIITSDTKAFQILAGDRIQISDVPHVAEQKGLDF